MSPRYGENALRLAADRYRLERAGHVAVGGLGRADRGRADRAGPAAADRPAGRLRDRTTGRPVSVVVHHLVPGVQRAGGYARTGRCWWRGTAARWPGCGPWSPASSPAGRRSGRSATATSTGSALPGLVSAWEGRRDDPRGTLGTSSARKIDDVLGPGPADEVLLLTSASDHAAVLARRAD